MDYKEKYEAALERAREIKSKILSSHLSTESCKAVSEYIDEIIPELSESEDEKVRKEIKQFILDTIGEISLDDKENAWLVWLEKQKEQKPNIELIQRSWYMEGYHDREFGKEPKWILKTGEGGPKHELNPRYGQPLAEQQPAQEQKPISTEDMPYVTDEHFFERESADSFKYRLAEYMTKNCTKKESPYGYTYSINSETILEMAKEELIKRGELQKPMEKQDYSGLTDFERAIHRGFLCAGVENVPVGIIKETAKDCLAHLPVEWSEEDEKQIAQIERIVKNAGCAKMLQDKIHNWLKSPHPQQKPVGWSDTNELVFKDICKHLKEEGYNGWIVVLEALRNGEFNQPSAEWSEADEAMKERLITRLNWITYNTRTDGTSPNITFFDEINWLKSLRPQWKPSEEQMDELRRVLIPGETFDCDILIGLLERLEELM